VLAYHLGISQDEDAPDERMGILVHRIDKKHLRTSFGGKK
jgi:hypothetical protein